jgi:hypothetical protein
VCVCARGECLKKINVFWLEEGIYPYLIRFLVVILPSCCLCFSFYVA